MWRTIKGGKNNGVVGKNHSQNQCDLDREGDGRYYCEILVGVVVVVTMRIENSAGLQK